MSTNRTFTVILEPTEESGFIVRVPALPEVSTCGDSEDEALAMAREAIELVIEHRLARGKTIPEENPSKVRQLTVAVPAAA